MIINYPNNFNYNPFYHIISDWKTKVKLTCCEGIKTPRTNYALWYYNRGLNRHNNPGDWY